LADGPQGRHALSVAALWPIDDNAVTLWPGSHRWPDHREPLGPGVPLAVEAGSCVLLLGTLWHTRPPLPARAAARLTVTAHYCEPWLRTREAFTLSPGRDVARQLTGRVRHMLGYSLHLPDTGLVDGLHPERLFA
uniref:hypothetical protein n=1 Tax=Nonomuraea sp. SBT364 TaxID=1580530 RepID=UPI00066D7B47